MAWITLTSADLRNRLSDVEFSSVGEAQLAAGQTVESVLAEVFEGVVRLIRGHAARKNTLGPAGTIPDETKDAALAILRFRVFTRLPDLGLLSDDRRTEYKDAMKLLDALGRGDFVIEAPAEASTEISAATSASEVVMARPDHVGGGRLAGL